MSTSATSVPLTRRSPKWDPFVVALFATVALAAVLPARGVFAEWLSRAVSPVIGGLFFLYGVRLPFQEAWAAVRNWRLQAAVHATTYVVFPGFGLACLLLAPRLISHELAQGLLFLAVLPSTVQSSIAFTSIAGGNVAGALCAASLSNLMGVLATPVLVAVLLGGAVAVSTGSVGAIAAQLVAPFLLGQLFRQRLLGWIRRHPRSVGCGDRGAILLVVYVAFSRGMTEGIWSQVAWRDLMTLTIASSVLLAVMLALAAFAGRLLGFERADRIVLMMCGSNKSLASGLPMATILLPAASVGLLVLPLMIYHQLQLLACSMIAQRMSTSVSEERN